MKRRTFLTSALAAPTIASVNPRIEQSRAQGLAALKPTGRELDHGLKLHANSVVVESYGFSPRLALDRANNTRCSLRRVHRTRNSSISVNR